LAFTPDSGLKVRRAVRFSEYYEITPTSEDDWFDPLLTVDTMLFPDPFRIYVDPDTMWADAHEHLLVFFNMVLDLLKRSTGVTSSASYGKAERLLIFPEPAEFCLGYGEATTLGSGSGRGLRGGMLEGALAAVGLGIETVEHMEELVLFEEGIGADRIGDLVCNILKSYFIRYTQAVAERHRLEMTAIEVRHADFSAPFERWDDAHVSLPINPYNHRGVLLVPERFLRALPTVDPTDFWNWAWSNDNVEIRGDFNYDVGKNVNAATKARLARQNPDIARDYLRSLEANPPPPYDAREDPEMRVRWYEVAAQVVEASPVTYLLESEDDFCEWVRKLVEVFKHAVENEGLWEMLWNDDGRPRAERQVQRLFRGILIHYCRAQDVDFTGEADAGRGPVDFKFSQGWVRRALVELKLMSNSHLWDGLEVQIRAYLEAELINCGYFVTIAFKESELKPTKQKLMEETAKRVSEETGLNLTPIVIDARPKGSASTLRSRAKELAMKKRQAARRKDLGW